MMRYGSLHDLLHNETLEVDERYLSRSLALSRSLTLPLSLHDLLHNETLEVDEKYD